MVAHSRTSSRADHLRPLNAPQPITVIADHATPIALVMGRHRHRVETIQDMWIVQDEWWRQPINRRYFILLLDDGSRHTVFLDREDATWYAQDY